jgi:hypothetical protein
VHDALLADAVRTGIVSLPLSRSLKPPPRRPVMTSAQLAALLDEGRANR